MLGHYETMFFDETSCISHGGIWTIFWNPDIHISFVRELSTAFEEVMIWSFPRSRIGYLATAIYEYLVQHRRGNIKVPAKLDKRSSILKRMNDLLLGGVMYLVRKVRVAGPCVPFLKPITNRAVGTLKLLGNTFYGHTIHEKLLSLMHLIAAFLRQGRRSDLNTSLPKNTRRNKPVDAKYFRNLSNIGARGIGIHGFLNLRTSELNWSSHHGLRLGQYITNNERSI